MRYAILALISIGNQPNNLETLCDFSVKIERFQIKSNVLNLKSTRDQKYRLSTYYKYDKWVTMDIRHNARIRALLHIN